MAAVRFSAAQLAAWTGRGARSAIGVHGFVQGGWIVDAGKREGSGLGTLAARAEFPGDWPIVLWTSQAVSGLAGQRERTALERLPPMPAALTDRLAGIALRELLPSLVDRDWREFSLGLRAYGDLAGSYFAPAQGGLYTDPQGEEIVRWLTDRGYPGVAQSSWGPTLAVVLPDEATAATTLRDWPFSGGSLRLTHARNRGADLRVLS